MKPGGLEVLLSEYEWLLWRAKRQFDSLGEDLAQNVYLYLLTNDQTEEITNAKGFLWQLVKWKFGEYMAKNQVSREATVPQQFWNVYQIKVSHGWRVQQQEAWLALREVFDGLSAERKARILRRTTKKENDWYKIGKTKTELYEIYKTTAACRQNRARYEQSEKGRIRRQRYAKSDKAKAAALRYRKRLRAAALSRP
jgi:hypothetical protein